jgi:hypothetical protein
MVWDSESMNPVPARCQRKHRRGLFMKPIFIWAWFLYVGVVSICRRSLNGVEDEGSPGTTMRSLAVYASSKRREPNACNKKTDLSEEDRKRNIVLFLHIFYRICKVGLTPRGSGVANGPPKLVNIKPFDRIPKIKEPFSGTSRDP